MMNPFQEMLQYNKRSLHFNKMSQLATLLDNRFGISHFWFYKIYLNGYYSYIGSHQEWDEYCYDTLCVKHFACLRHPECLRKGIDFMRTTKDKEYLGVLETASEKFKVNFKLNLVDIASDGIEAVGFATHFNDEKIDNFLFKNIHILKKLTNEFKSEHKIFNRMGEQVVYLPTELNKYYECPKTLIVPFENNDQVISLNEFNKILSLTPREKDTLKLVARGYPLDFMAAKLCVSVKTIENYLSSLKSKFSCDSTTNLIKKAYYVEKTNYFDF